MPGYLGSKAVLLSTTAANVTGNASITGDLTVDTNTLFVDSANNAVGIGTTDTTSEAQAGKLKVRNDVDYSSTEFEDNATLVLQNETDNHSAALVFHSDNGSNSSKRAGIVGGNINSNTSAIGFYGDISNKTSATKPDVIIDSSGNVLVGTTSSSGSGDGIVLGANDQIIATRNGAAPLWLNRRSSDGDIALFNKDGATVGSIGSRAGVVSYIVLDPRSGGTGLSGGTAQILPTNTSGTTVDNVADLGASSVRWDDVYATNGTIQTSDRNEKQDIAELDEAEKRVAIAAKGLLRKFRWKDAVAEKGDDARIHFGIIAQDLQAAFEAEGLDAGRYAMFISSTWWEADEVIPAVEAQDAVYETQADEDGNEVQVLVSEAVEAQPERTVTHTYETAEEAPEGAVERTRLGVRYPELLAFIIGAM